EVNANDIADKSLSRVSVQPVTQPKAPTNLKIKKKRIPPSSIPKSPYKGSQRSTSNDNVIDITPKDDEERDASNSNLHFMPTDNLNATSYGNFTLPYACPGVSSLSNPLGHLQRELTTISSKVNQLESQVTKRVSDEFKSSVPSLDSIKSFASESIAEELRQVDAQIQKNFQDQLPDLLLKPIYIKKSIRLRVCTRMKEVRNKLSACTSTVATNSQHVQDIRIMFHDMVSLLEAAEVFKKANAEGEKWEKNKLETPKDTEEKKSEGVLSVEDDSDKDDLDKQTL
nr:hypothetical protein [Tanacetum cinerariifolium]